MLKVTDKLKLISKIIFLNEVPESKNVEKSKVREFFIHEVDFYKLINPKNKNYINHNSFIDSVTILNWKKFASYHYKLSDCKNSLQYEKYFYYNNIEKQNSDFILPIHLDTDKKHEMRWIIYYSNLK
jgi:hypothetical protein